MNLYNNRNRRQTQNERQSIFKYNISSTKKTDIDTTFQYNDLLFPSLSIAPKINNSNTQNNYLNELKKTNTIRGIKKQKKNVSDDDDTSSSITDKYDFTPVIKMWQKRKDEYIDLYGLDIYEKMFIFPNKIYNDYDVDNDVEDKIYTTEYENYDEIYDVYY